MTRIFLFAAPLLGVCAGAATPEWIVRSNQNSQIVLDVQARFGPEGAAALGLNGYDDKVIDLGPRFVERRVEAYTSVLTELHKRLAAETDPRVKQDLEITIRAIQLTISGLELDRK